MKKNKAGLLISVVILVVLAVIFIRMFIKPEIPGPNFELYCIEDNYDCETMLPKENPQALYDECMDLEGYDVHNLDFNGNGVACDEEDLKYQKIEEALKPGITELCEYLDSKIIASSCAKCQVSDYQLVDSLEGMLPRRTVWYVLEESEENYLVQARVYTTYGRNTYMGSQYANFTLDKELNIVEKNFPENTCV